MNACLLCERDLHGDAAAFLCPGCTRAVGERLDRMPKLHAALVAWLAPAGRRPELVSTRPAEAPLPVSEVVLTLRGPGGIVGVLEDWRAAMQADRGWGQPAVRGDLDRRITAAARGLGMNLEWIAASWPAAGEFARELRDLERAALSVIDPPERTVRVGYCVTPADDGGTCAAVLRYTPGSGLVRCPWCQSEYPPSSWLVLAADQTPVQEMALPR